MMAEILRELTVIKESYDVPSQQVLIWTKRIEVQRAQKVVLNQLKNVKNLIWWKKQTRVVTTKATHRGTEQVWTEM